LLLTRWQGSTEVLVVLLELLSPMAALQVQHVLCLLLHR
jgi:hypothetical protein